MHSNLAKQLVQCYVRWVEPFADVFRMLYDFHHRQTAKKPESVHATYLITGTRKPRAPTKTNGTQDRDGEDRFMQSSPFMSSMPVQADGEEEHIPVTSILLAKEEDLDGRSVIALDGESAVSSKKLTLADAKAQFDKITSIHVYSLEPGTLKVMAAATTASCLVLTILGPASVDGLQPGNHFKVRQRGSARVRKTVRHYTKSQCQGIVVSIGSRKHG